MRADTFSLSIDLANGVFRAESEDGRQAACPELAWLLRELASTLEDTEDVRRLDNRKVVDSNGNTVGRVTVGETS